MQENGQNTPSGATATSAGNVSDAEDDGSSSSAEEIEPKLKYERLSNNAQTILQNDAVSCVTFNSKIICIGTRWGLVHIFDHQGNSIHIEHLRSHTVAVNQISVDLAGEYIATCSDDGKAYVYGLYTTEHQLQFSLGGRCIRTVAIDPLYYKLGAHRRFVTGCERLLLHERSYFMTGLKTSVLYESVGVVHSMKWYGRFVAYAYSGYVRLYDIEERKHLLPIRWDSPAERGLALEQYPCSITWKNASTLLVGWLNTFRICRVEKRYSVVRESPSYTANVVSTLRVDYHICGICPFDASQLVLLACEKERDANGAALPPRMYVLQMDDEAKYAEVYSDALSLRSYRDCACADYRLECLPDENRFIIACPKDVIVASIYDGDDRVEWLVGHEKFEEAMEVVASKQRQLQRNTLLAVGKRFIDHLLQRGDYPRAGEMCARVLGANKQLWENEVFKFARAGQLRAICRHLPVDLPNRLDAHIYEMVLYEYLKREPEHFLRVVQQWSPSLYNVKAVLHAALEHVLKNPNSNVDILESVAVLYSHDHQHEKAMRVYSSIKHKGVFALIRKHKLYRGLDDQIKELMELDAQEAVSVFLGSDKERGPDADRVVEKLQHNQYHLYLYLDALDTDQKNEGRKYHPRLVRLYANFCPQKLLPLLRRSHNYPIHEALAICKERNLYAEMVYLLDRMGNTREALQLLIEKIGDVEQAIRFCKEHSDGELWEELVEYSLARPEFVKYLLQKIGTYVDPRVLIRRLGDDTNIPGLKGSLVKVLQDRSLQISIRESCKNIVVSDSYNLHKSLVGMQQCGYGVDDSLVCNACNQKVLIKDNSCINMLVFYCRHTFHEACLPAAGGAEKCIICSSQHSGRGTVT